MDMCKRQLVWFDGSVMFSRFGLRVLLSGIRVEHPCESCLTFGLLGECSDPSLGFHFVHVQMKELLVLVHLCFFHDVVVHGTHSKARFDCAEVASLLRIRWATSLQSESFGVVVTVELFQQLLPHQRFPQQVGQETEPPLRQLTSIQVVQLTIMWRVSR